MEEGAGVEIEGERIVTMTVERAPESSIHTLMQNLNVNVSHTLGCFLWYNLKPLNHKPYTQNSFIDIVISCNRVCIIS